MTNILIHGGNVSEHGNKGDQLMLLAVDEFLSQLEFPLSKVISPSAGGFTERTSLGFHQLLWRPGFNRLSKSLGYMMLNRYRHSFGIKNHNEIDVILNIMGYRYFDVGARETQLDLMQVKSMRNLKALIFLPQAYGPFESATLRKDIRSLFSRASLIYARDPESKRHLDDVLVGNAEVQLSPDMTIPLKGRKPPYRFKENQVAIVPNVWMLERTNTSVSKGYITFIERVIKRCMDEGQDWYLLDHSPFQDSGFKRLIEDKTGLAVPVVSEQDPLVTKWLLGQSRFVLASRYHALVSALSQDVPVLATSWAPKYKGLMSDYNVERFLVEPAQDEMAVDHLLDELFGSGSISRVKADLSEKNQLMHSKVRDMWLSVAQSLASSCR